MANQNPEHFNRLRSHPGETTINSSFLLRHVGPRFPSSLYKAVGQPTGELSQAPLQLVLPFERAAPDPQYSRGNARLRLGTLGLATQQTAGANRQLLRVRFNYLSLKIRLLTRCRFNTVKLHLVARAITGTFSDTRSWLLGEPPILQA